MLVSACMIVRNEEANLDRCLRSLEGKVDEVVVVDTGSTDRTVAIAQEHGAKVFSFTWCDDFAAARNESIRRASGDWLFWLDADEELVEETAGALRLLCRQPNPPQGYLVSCRNLASEAGDVSTIIRQWRLFRNHIGLRFNGRVHEHLRHADGSRDAVLNFQDEVWIRHWGYIPEPERTKRKRDRNLRLIERAIQDSPDDPFFHYNLGKQYVAEFDFETGLRSLERALELWQKQGRPEQAYVGNMLALAMNAAYESQRYQRAVDIETVVPQALVSADTLFQAGAAWWRLGQRDKATERFNRAWQDPAVRQGIEGDPSSSTWRPRAALAQMQLEAGNTAEAYELAKQAHAYAPTLPNLLQALAITCAKLQRYDESLSWARRILELDGHDRYKLQARRLMLNVGQGLNDQRLVAEALAGPAEGIDEAEAILMRAEAFAKLGEVQAQYDALDAGCQALPADFRLRLALAAVLDQQGFTGQAANVLGAGLDQPDPPIELYQQLALVLTKQGRFEDAANALRLVGQMTASPVA